MKRKFNFFDVLIIIVIIAIAVFGIKLFTDTSEDAALSVDDVSFTVEIKECENDLANKIKPGDKIYDSIKGGYYGEVTDVQTAQSTAVVANTKEGKYELVEYPNRTNVYVTIKGTPTSMTDANIQFASQKVKVGTVAYLKSHSYVGYGYVVNINIEE